MACRLVGLARTGKPAALADLRPRQVTTQARAEHEHHRETRTQPDRAPKTDLSEYRDVANGDEDNAGDVGEDGQQARREHHIGGRGTRAHLVVGAIEFVIIAAVPLDAVTEIARSQNKRTREHDGVEVKVHQADEPETPNRGAGTSHNWRPPAAATPETQVEDGQHERDRERENKLDARQVVIPPRRKHCGAACVDPRIGVLVLADNVLDTVEQPLVIEAALVEARDYQFALAVAPVIARQMFAMSADDFLEVFDF